MSAAAGLLAGLHAAIALRRDEPHWLLSDADAKRYGKALADAMRWLPVTVAQKSIDFSVLAFCAFEMEAPRIMRSRQLAAARARGPIPPGGATVFRFTPPPGANGREPPPRPPPAGAAAAPAPEPPLAEPPPDDGGETFGP